MKTLFLVLTLNCFFSFSQKEIKDYALQRNLKQEGEQFQFQVLDEDKKGVWFHRKTKFYFWYKAQHVISTQGGSSGVLLNGDFESFHDNKQLSKKGFFRRGLKSGEWLYWREDGTLKISEQWSKGTLKSRTIFNMKGEEKEKTTFKTNSYYKVTNDTILHSKKGDKKQEIIIKNNQGEVTRVERRKNGKLHGKVKNYSNGKLVEEKKYEEGVLIVDEDTKIKDKNESTKNKRSIKDWFKKEKQIRSKKEKKKKEPKSEKRKNNTFDR